jgi:hypothetical protein
VNMSDPNGHCYNYVCETQQDWDDFHAEGAERNYTIAEGIRNGTDWSGGVRGWLGRDKYFDDLGDRYTDRMGKPPKIGQMTTPEMENVIGAGGAIAGGAARSATGYRSFNSFNELKSALGPAGPGKVWGHLVEQCQAKCTRAAFPSRMINNTNNVVKMPKAVNQAMADYYSSKPGGKIFGNKTVRDWLDGQSFKKQQEFARKTYERLKEKYEKTAGTGKQWWK